MRIISNKKIVIIIGVSILIIAIILGIIFVKKDKNNGIENIAKNNELLINENREDEEFIYLAYDIKEEVNGKYNLNIKIPLFKTETEITKSINSNIINIFGNKLKNVMEGESYATYSIKYQAYNNNNIISLVITAELKEGNNPKRKIIKTYNYDIQNDKLLNLSELINTSNLDKVSIQKVILEEIKTKNSKLEELKEQGYNVYIRDINSEIYNLENITTYFLGGDGILHIVFAYGNNNYTTESDTIIF